MGRRGGGGGRAARLEQRPDSFHHMSPLRENIDMVAGVVAGVDEFSVIPTQTQGSSATLLMMTNMDMSMRNQMFFLASASDFVLLRAVVL